LPHSLFQHGPADPRERDPFREKRGKEKGKGDNKLPYPPHLYPSSERDVAQGKKRGKKKVLGEGKKKKRKKKRRRTSYNFAYLSLSYLLQLYLSKSTWKEVVKKKNFRRGEKKKKKREGGEDRKLSLPLPSFNLRRR